MIQIKNLTKSYGKKTVLKDINLNFEKGKVYGIVGENGAGKTTLFRCISGLEKYNGKITSPLTPIKDYTGLLLTNPFFFSKITGKEYIQLLCIASDIKLDNIEKRNIFNLPLNQYASTYSTGMKKKLAITSNLLLENELFILDDPFNGVDIQSNIVITEIIRKLRELGKTIIMSSHIFSTLNDTCDHIYLLENGEVTKEVNKEHFHQLEEEMKIITIGNRIEQMNLK